MSEAGAEESRVLTNGHCLLGRGKFEQRETAKDGLWKM